MTKWRKVTTSQMEMTMIKFGMGAGIFTIGYTYSDIMIQSDKYSPLQQGISTFFVVGAIAVVWWALK